MNRPEHLERWLGSALQALTTDFDDVIPGIDVVSVPDFEHLIRIGGQQFLTRQFTSAELSECGSNGERLAARFAAKEATVKVLRTGFRRGIAARHIEIKTNKSGMPHVMLHGPAAERAEQMSLRLVNVTLTHDADLAAAAAIGRRENETV